MPKKHAIRRGESLLQLAYDAGFASWTDVWNDAANAELRERRADPQVLLPGDELTIPERREGDESCPVQKVHRFRLARPRAWLNLKMVGGDGEPIANARHTVTLERTHAEGTTDDAGMISVEIDPDEHHGTLRLWFDPDQPPFEAPLFVGDLDPATAPTGLRGRATNLGLGWRDADALHDNERCLSHPLGLLCGLYAEGEPERLPERLQANHDE